MFIRTTKSTVFGECSCIFECWCEMNAHNLSKVSLCTNKILIVMHIDNIGNNKYTTYSTISRNFFVCWSFLWLQLMQHTTFYYRCKVAELQLQKVVIICLTWMRGTEATTISDNFMDWILIEFDINVFFILHTLLPCSKKASPPRSFYIHIFIEWL